MSSDGYNRNGSAALTSPAWVGYAVTIVAELALSAGLLELYPIFPLGKFPIAYVLLTMVVAYFFGGGPAIVAGVSGWIAFTSLFVPRPGVFWPIATTPEGWARELAFFLGVTVVAIAAIQTRKSQRRIRRMAQETMRLNESLTTEIAERERAEEDVRKINAELEQRVRERTAELEATNKEIEAFSYSVSHDLRAPLRAIDGFSDTLLKRYSGSLDEKGRDYLARVRVASQRMARLIDDILGLSRAGRAEIRLQHVDLSAMAHDILAVLRKSEPKRKAEFRIEEGLVVNADMHLLRSALENLLGNAWKFTGGRDVARIEVGSTEQDGERVYFVRDNGVGFNPAYADKLFFPFQRLHSQEEFPGTGVGLALAQRIIHRHGGRIWAESAVDQGATFYFILKGGNDGKM